MNAFVWSVANEFVKYTRGTLDEIIIFWYIRFNVLLLRFYMGRVMLFDFIIKFISKSANILVFNL